MEEIQGLKNLNEIQMFSIKGLLETNINNKSNTYKMCLRLNVGACLTCNQYSTTIIKKHFKMESICFVLSKNDSALINILELKNYNVIYEDSLFKFNSIDPVFFIRKDSTYFFRFSPNSFSTILLNDYINSAKKIIN